MTEQESTHSVGSGGNEVPLEDTIASAAQIEAKEDDALASIFGGMADDDDDVGSPYENQAVETPAEDSPAEEAPAEASEETPAEETTPDDTDYLIAEAILRRDGWSAEDLAKLPPEAVKAMGDKRSKVQTDTDSAYKELTTLRETGGTPPGERTGSKNDAEAPPVKVDPMESVRVIAEQLALDDDGAKALANWQASMTEPLRQQLEESHQLSQRAMGAVVKMEVESARQALGERYPWVKDATSPDFKRVLERMTVLDKSGAYQDTTKLMEDATVIEFRDELKAQASERTNQIRKARANGQTTTTKVEPNANATTAKPLTPEQKEDAVLQALDSGEGTHDERLARARQFE